MRGMLKITSTVAALALMTAPLAAQGGPGRGGPAMGRGMMRGGPEAVARNPVAVVLEHADALELTADQVATLEGLKAELEQVNDARWQRLKDAFGDADPREMTVEERQALRARMQELQPVRDEIRAANRAVMDQVHELLTADQEATLHGLMRRGAQGRPGRGMRARRPGDRAIGAAWRSGYRDGWTRGWRAAHRAGPPGG